MRRCSWMILLMVPLILSLTGCSSVLTYFGPLKSELEDGDKYPGEFVSYRYQMRSEGDALTFTKTPVCKETVQKLRVAKKQRRGFYMALLEMPIFGLGLFDMLRSYAIVEESRKVEPLGRYDTGKQMPCNGTEPAAHETMVISDKARGIRITAQTDGDGGLRLGPLLSDFSGPAAVKIYPKDGPSDVFTHKYPAETFR